jgi:hypothetical protein
MARHNSQTEAAVKAEAETEPGVEPAVRTEAEVKAEVETEAAAKTETETKAGAAAKTEAEAKAEVETEAATKTEAETKAGAGTEAANPGTKPVMLHHKSRYQKYRCAGLILTQKQQYYQVTPMQLLALKIDPWVEINEVASE